MSGIRASDTTAEKSPASGGDLQPKKFWEVANLGFDTGKKLWFIQFFSETNENVGLYYAKSVTFKNGTSMQYEWKDAQGRPFWHVRERFFAEDIESFSIDPAGVSITLKFKGEGATQNTVVAPADFDYLLYAFHLTTKDGGRAPMGFVELYNSNGEMTGRLDNRWIIVEGVARRTFGEFPNIRLRVEHKDVGQITVTHSAVVIQGNQQAGP